jgi:hypothetical protein
MPPSEAAMPESDVPGRRAAKLAERMARLLRDEEITDIAVALALLTSGVVMCGTLSRPRNYWRRARPRRPASRLGAGR